MGKLTHLVEQLSAPRIEPAPKLPTVDPETAFTPTETAKAQGVNRTAMIEWLEKHQRAYRLNANVSPKRELRATDLAQRFGLALNVIGARFQDSKGNWRESIKMKITGAGREELSRALSVKKPK